MAKTISRVEVAVLSVFAAAIVLTATWPLVPWVKVYENPYAAGWVQAFGSIGAILVAIAVVRHQHESALAIQQRAERDRQVLMCTRALLAVEGFLNSLRDYKSALAKVPTGPFRPFAIAELGTINVIVPMDLDSLAFLVGQDAGELLNDFSSLHCNERQWHLLLRDLMKFCDQEITPLVAAEVRSAKRALRPEEFPAIVGRMAYGALSYKCQMIESLVNAGSEMAPSDVASVRNKVQLLYPEARLPKQADTTAALP
jgi:hypothetical protein